MTKGLQEAAPYELYKAVIITSEATKKTNTFEIIGEKEKTEDVPYVQILNNYTVDTATYNMTQCTLVCLKKS